MTDSGVRRFPHQAAARVVLGDFRHGTAHVHVDDIRAHPFDDARRLGHLFRIAAEDLNRDRALFLGVFRVLERAVDAADEALGADHLGHDQPATAVAFHQAAKGGVGHARHRRNGKRRGQFDVPDLHDSVAFHIRRIDFDADRLSDHVDGQHQPRARGVLAHQAADYSL